MEELQQQIAAVDQEIAAIRGSDEYIAIDDIAKKAQLLLAKYNENIANAEKKREKLLKCAKKRIISDLDAAFTPGADINAVILAIPVITIAALKSSKIILNISYTYAKRLCEKCNAAALAHVYSALSESDRTKHISNSHNFLEYIAEYCNVGIKSQTMIALINQKLVTKSQAAAALKNRTISAELMACLITGDDPAKNVQFKIC